MLMKLFNPKKAEGGGGGGGKEVCVFSETVFFVTFNIIIRQNHIKQIITTFFYI